MNLERYSRAAAELLSAAFSPPLVVCYGAASLFPRLDETVFWAPLIVAVFVVPPALYVLFLMRKGAVSGFHLSKHPERFRPLKFMVINTSLGMLIFSKTGSPVLVLDVVLACLLALLAVYSATLFYKVSAHSAAVSSLWIILCALYGGTAAFFAPLLPLVSWARARLAVHTVAQTVAGCFIGASVTFAVLRIKGHF